MARTEERWNIRRKLIPASGLTDEAVTGPDTDWIEVIPASSLERVAAELDSRADHLEQHAEDELEDGAIQQAYGEALGNRAAASLLRDRAVSREEPTDAPISTRAEEEEECNG